VVAAIATGLSTWSWKWFWITLVASGALTMLIQMSLVPGPVIRPQLQRG
jgi:hypothetical protein